MILDRVIAAVALMTLTGYLGIFVFSVPRTPLFIAVGFVLVLAFYDFWNQLFRDGKR